MDAAARREKRQAKIRAAGADRLAKITKTTNPNAEDYKSSPVTAVPTDESKRPAPQQPLASDPLHDDDPVESFPEHHHQQQVQAMPEIPAEFQNDPLFKLMSELQQNYNGDANAPDPFDNPFQTLNTMFSGMGDQQAPVAPPGPKRINGEDLFWTVLHVFSVIALTVYVALINRGSITVKFCTLELILNTSRFVFERGSPPANSMLASFAQYLPPPFKDYLITAARYMRYGQVLFRDASLSLFVLGICSLL